MISEDDHSLDYIEDPYFNPLDSTNTPSLDEVPDGIYDENDIYDGSDELLDAELELFDLKQLDFDDLNSLPSLNGDENFNVEAEFFNVKRANAIIRTFFKKNFKKQVRVTYSDLTKPYLAKLPKESNFRKYLEISMTGNGKFKFIWLGSLNTWAFVKFIKTVIKFVGGYCDKT